VILARVATPASGRAHPERHLFTPPPKLPFEACIRYRRFRHFRVAAASLPPAVVMSGHRLTENASNTTPLQRGGLSTEPCTHVPHSCLPYRHLASTRRHVAASVEASHPARMRQQHPVRAPAPRALHSDTGRSQRRCLPCRFSLRVCLVQRSLRAHTRIRANQSPPLLELFHTPPLLRHTASCGARLSGSAQLARVCFPRAASLCGQPLPDKPQLLPPPR
jgi:hypothetical protein